MCNFVNHCMFISRNMSNIHLHTIMSELKKILLIGAASYDIQSVANQLAGETLFPNPAPTIDFRVVNPSTPQNGQMIQLTVAPGFVDYRVNQTPKQMASVIKNELQSEKYRQGFHMVVVVMSYPLRWTDEERDTINFTYNLVGQENLKNRGALILNNGNNFKQKYPQNTLGHFQTYLHQQAEQQAELKDFVGLFRENVLILDTELQDQELNGDQLEQFFQTVATRNKTFRVQKQGGYHTDDEGESYNCCSIL